jgi:uncharacterized protein (DUF1501 family)
MDAPNPQRCIDCEEIELANVHDLAPSQVLPIPALALAGFPDGRSPRELTRRRLLQFGVAGFASIYAPKLLGWQSVWESAVAEADTAPNANCLVMLYLGGGNDGLNVIVPNSSSDYPIYTAKRPVLHRGQGPTVTGRVGSQLVPASGGGLAFANPTVTSTGGGDNGDANFGFDTLYGNGLGGAGSDLALLPAVDYTPPNLSHFTSSDYWFAGDLTTSSATGWLGRWLDLNGSANNPLQGISIGQSLSKALRPASAPVSTISSLGSLGFNLKPGYGSPLGDPTAVDPNAILNQLAGVQAGANNAQLTRSRSQFGLAVDVYNKTHSLAPFVPGSGYPSPSSLASQLQLAAFLLGAGLGTRIITIHWGGFDTHGGQIGQQDPQLKELSRALGAFQADLANRGIANQVATLMFSEFGRRVAENGSAGTDHGAGGLMMLSGSKVKGGYASPFPGLSSLDQTGDLKVPTDFRSVYAEVIAQWLGGDPNAVLPTPPLGGFQTIHRYDGATGLFN